MTLLLQSTSFELWWEPQQGVLRLQSPGRTLAGILGVEFTRQGRFVRLTTDKLTQGRITHKALKDAHGQAEEILIRYQDAQGVALELRVRIYAHRPFVLFQLALTNVGPGDIHLCRFYFESVPDGLTALADPIGVYANGWQSWSSTGFLSSASPRFALSLFLKFFQGPMIQNSGTPWSKKAGRFWSESVAAIVTPKEALIVGAASLADQFVQVCADVRFGQTTLMLQSQADDVSVEVGAVRTSEWFYVEWVPLPNVDPLAQYAYAVVRQMAVPPQKSAPTGWCSWYMYGNKVSEANVIENLASAALLADEIPLQVLQLDEGYQPVWGDWTERNARFPHDLKWLAARMRGSGFRPGLWLGPMTAYPKSHLVADHPAWVLRNRRGRPVSPGLISGGRAYALDPTHPGMEIYLRKLIRKVVDEWGFTYLKLDFMYAAALAGRRYNPHLTRAQALRHALRIIRDTAGPDVYVVGCGTPLGPAVGLVDAMRIGPDTAPEWGPSYGRLGRFMRQNPSLPSLRNSLRNVATRAWMHNRWWTNDPDTLLMRDRATALTSDEVLAQVTLLALSGGLFILSDDLDGLPPERRALLSATLPQLLEGMDMLDLFEKSMPETALVPVALPWGHWYLLALFNWRDVPVERALPDMLPLDERKAYHVIDFWEQRYFRFQVEGSVPVLHLPPHGVVLLGIRAVKPVPQLVATTFHISQGAEITAWDVGESSVSLSLGLGRLAQGEVWLALPARPTAAFLNDEPLPAKAIRTVSSGVWAVACRFKRAADLRVAWGVKRDM